MNHWAAAIGTATVGVVALIATQSPFAVAAGAVPVAVALSLSTLTGEREWSLLPAATLATALIAPDRSVQIIAVVAVGASIAAVVKPERTATLHINTLSAIVAAGLIAATPQSVVAALQSQSVQYADALILMALGSIWFAIDTVLWLMAIPAWKVTYRSDLARLTSDWRVALITLVASFGAASQITAAPIVAALAALFPLAIALQLRGISRRRRQLVHRTAQALGRLPESAGLVQKGHTREVTDLAVAMGRVSGVGARDVDILRRAASLHGIGMLKSSEDQIDEGLVSADVHRWGAEILSSSPTFAVEAEVLAAMADPHRTPGADGPATSHAQIVRVACRAAALMERYEPSHAIERLYADSVYTLDQSAVRLVRPALALLGAEKATARG